MDHPLSGSLIAFATMHGKEKILDSLFQQSIGAKLVVPRLINTDNYGTFSGEVSRLQSVKEVLRAKAREGADLLGLNYGLASEGSFGAHPRIPFLECNQESLMFLDLKNEIEVFSHVISTENCAEYRQVKTEEDLLDFCHRVNLGAQAVILKPSYEYSNMDWIVKGLTDEQSVIEAFHRIKDNFSLDNVWVEKDNRAHFNPQRQKVIYQVGEKLINTLSVLCPSCKTPGFQMTDFIKGLKCLDCGLKSDKPLKEIWSCPSKKCTYSETRPRLDGVKMLSPAECHWCNP